MAQVSACVFLDIFTGFTHYFVKFNIKFSCTNCDYYISNYLDYYNHIGSSLTASLLNI